MTTRRTLGIIAVAATTFVVSLLLFTRANAFPLKYHPDELSKAEQVARGDHNFNHPQLLLRAAEGVAWVRTGRATGQASPDEPMLPHYQRIVVGGRWASAAFAAAAAALLAALAIHVRGLLAGVMAGVGLAVFGPLLSLAHFFKEDTVLVFTLAVWLVTSAWYLRRQSFASLIAFGLACGLVLGGKWIGVVLTIFGLVLIGWHGIGGGGKSRRLTAVLSATAAASVMVLLSNLPAVWQFRRLLHGWTYEATHVATGHGGLILPRLPIYGRELLLLGPIVLGLAVFELVHTLRRSDRRWPGWWLLPLVAVGWIGLVSLSQVVSPRYLLPTGVLLIVIAAMGLASLRDVLWARPSRRSQILAGGIVAALAVGWIAPHAWRSFGYLQAFMHDTRQDARRWLNENLPPDARLLYDNWTGLWPWDVPVPAEMRPLPLANTTAQQLAAEGFTHLAVGEYSYRPLLTSGVRPTSDYRQTFETARDRYRQLLSHPALVTFEPRYDPPTHMSPVIHVYRLADWVDDSTK